MTDNVKKYSWQFFRYFIVGYIVGFAMILGADLLLQIKLQDIFLIVILCFAVSNAITLNFIKQEKRYFNELEQRSLIKRSSLMALSISMIPSVLFVGYCIAVKLFFTPQEVSKLLADINLPNSDTLQELLKMNALTLFGILLATTLLYYLIIRVMLGWSFRQLARRYSVKPTPKN